MTQAEKNDFFEKANKIPKKDRYFNISVLWIAYFPRMLRLLYYLKIPHEWVSLLSMLFGVLTALLIFNAAHYGWFLAAAIAFHFKDIFDACDGSLARLTKRGHRIGRFMDSISDFLTITLTVIAVIYIGWQTDPWQSSLFTSWEIFTSADPGLQIPILIAGIFTILSIFLQCSYFNYYQVNYVNSLEENRLLSRTDETITEADKKIYNHAFLQGLLLFLQGMYKIIYGWQDKVMHFLDKKALALARVTDLKAWYQAKPFLVANSVFVFGTHIFIILIFLLLGNPVWSFLIIAGVMNLYWIIIFIVRILLFRTHSGLSQSR